MAAPQEESELRVQEAGKREQRRSRPAEAFIVATTCGVLALYIGIVWLAYQGVRECPDPACGVLVLFAVICLGLAAMILAINRSLWRRIRRGHGSLLPALVPAGLCGGSATVNILVVGWTEASPWAWLALGIGVGYLVLALRPKE